jgi:hypothetical protein
MTKINNPEAKRAGFKRGRVILKKVLVGPAPRIKEASIKLGGSSLYLTKRMGMANPRPKTVWAIKRV